MMMRYYEHKLAIQKSAPIRALIERLGFTLETVSNCFTGTDADVARRFVSRGATQREATALVDLFKQRRTAAQTEVMLKEAAHAPSS